MVEEDLPQVRKLNNKHIAAVGEVSAKKYKYLFKIAHHAFVIKDQDQVVAFYLTVGADLDYKSKNYLFHANQGYVGFIYMDRIVVDDNYQNMKIGTKLYAHLENEMKREKLGVLCAEVNLVPPNPGSIRFHKRLGFKIMKHAHEHEPGYVVDFMAKELIPGALKLKSQKKEEPKKEAAKFECDVCKKQFPNKQEHLKSTEHQKLKQIKQKLYADDNQDAKKKSQKEEVKKVDDKEPEETVVPVEERKVEETAV